MPPEGRLAIEGEPAKPYKLYRAGLNDELVGKLAEANTREQLWRIHNRQLDFHNAILHHNKRIWPPTK